MERLSAMAQQVAREIGAEPEQNGKKELTKYELEQLVLLPDSVALRQELAETKEALANAIGQKNPTEIRFLQIRVDTAAKRIGLGEQRDALSADRPEGCWCLGLLGKEERYAPAGVRYFQQWCTCPEAVIARTEADRQREEAYRKQEADRIARGWEKAELPTRFQQYQLGTSPLAKTKRDLLLRFKYPGDCPPDDAADEVLQDWSTRIDDWLRSWFLWGSYGTGKTGIAVGYAREVLRHWGAQYGTWAPIKFKPTPDLFSELRDTYNNKSELSEGQIIKQYGSIPVLILDDIGAEHVKDTGWVEDRLYQIVGRRHGEELTTVFTSNLNLEQLAAKIGERVTWRIVEMCGEDHIIHVTGPNLRDR